MSEGTERHMARCLLGGAQANHVQSVENGRCKLWQLSVPDSEYVASETQPIAWRGTAPKEAVATQCAGLGICGERDAANCLAGYRAKGVIEQENY